MLPMQIAFITAPRTSGADYLPSTIRSAVKSDVSVKSSAIAVFADAVSLPPLPLPVGEVHLRTKEEIEFYTQKKVRGTANRVRALRWASQGRGYVCLCEDDLNFSRLWACRAEALARAAESISPLFLLSLHHLYDLTIDFNPIVQAGGDQLIAWKMPEKFYGSQGVVMTPGMATILADTWEQHLPPNGTLQGGGDEKYKWMSDLGMKRTCIDNKAPIYSCNPCLIQHVGEDSCVHPGRPPLVNRYFKP